MANIREKNEFMQSQFQTLAYEISNIIPFKWNAVILGFFRSGKDDAAHIQFWAMTELHGDYENLMKKLWNDSHFLDGTERIQKICADIHLHCSSVHDNWTEFTFVRLSDGSYTADFEYDGIPEFNSHYVAEWQSRFLL